VPQIGIVAKYEKGCEPLPLWDARGWQGGNVNPHRLFEKYV